MLLTAQRLFLFLSTLCCPGWGKKQAAEIPPLSWPSWHLQLPSSLPGRMVRALVYVAFWQLLHQASRSSVVPGPVVSWE